MKRWWCWYMHRQFHSRKEGKVHKGNIYLWCYKCGTNWIYQANKDMWV